MLEVTVLKVAHTTTEEACKLRSHLGDADIFCPEFAYMTDAAAVSIEREWEESLQFSRSKFRKEYLVQWEQTNVDTNIRNYLMKRDELVHRARLPIYSLERWDENSGIELEASTHVNNQLIDRATEALLDQDIEQYFSAMDQYFTLLKQTADERDKHMAENLANAEQFVQERYTISAEPVQLVAAIGALHFPEKYLPASCKVINLYDFSNVEMDLEHRYFREGRTPETERLMLIDTMSYWKQKGEGSLAGVALASLDRDQLIDLAFGCYV